MAERPYGWAWLVMLHGECRRLAGSPRPALASAGKRWAASLGPLNRLLQDRLVEYFSIAPGVCHPGGYPREHRLFVAVAASSGRGDRG